MRQCDDLGQSTCLCILYRCFKAETTWRYGSMRTFTVINVNCLLYADCEQRKVSLSTLQSKAAKRRDDAQKKTQNAKKKTSSSNVVSRPNGFTAMTDKRSKLRQQMELELIQVDTVQPHRKRVSFLTIWWSFLLLYLLRFRSLRFALIVTILVTVDVRKSGNHRTLCTVQKEDKDKRDKYRESDGVVAMSKEDDLEEIDQKDDGYIELVLRVLARMCDGQHKGLQVYIASLSGVKHTVSVFSSWRTGLLHIAAQCYTWNIKTWTYSTKSQRSCEIFQIIGHEILVELSYARSDWSKRWEFVQITGRAMLAQLSSCVCPSVRPSVRHKLELYKDG